jgi:hypothetical protein
MGSRRTSCSLGGERAVPELIYAPAIRAVEGWRRIWITEFEQCQLK